MKRYPVVMPSFFQYLSWGPLRASMKLFCSFEVRGIENINGLKGGIIIASNHISELDPLLISACLPLFSKHFPLYYVSREKDFYENGWRSFLYGGTFFRMMGAYPAYVGLKNYHHALRHHLNLIRQGRGVVIFPTGETTRKKYLQNELVKAKGGVAFLARETQSLVVPVLIQGIEDFSFAAFLGGKRKLIITFGAPLRQKDIFQDIDHVIIDENRNDYEKAAAVLMKKIIQLA